MTIEEFSKQYYPSKEECEKIALERIISKFANLTYSKSIRNSLNRVGIFTIGDLLVASEDQIKNICYDGEKRRFEVIMEIKEYIKNCL